MHAHDLGPSYTGTVVLDIGGDTGALIINAGPEQHRLEIEISQVRSDAPSDGPPRTHAAVRERRLAGGVRYTAVYPDLHAGTYMVWRDASTPATTVTITGGSITEYQWPG
jgi:hypothetical protein